MTRVYTLYPKGSSFSNKSQDYAGEQWHVLTDSLRQAYFYAYQQIGAQGPEKPEGIIERYRRGGWGDGQGWHALWCGCRLHEFYGFEHGKTRAAVVRTMNTHTRTYAHTQ